MTGQKVSFIGSQGTALAAVLENPTNGTPRAYALFAHCFTCTKDIFSARYLTSGLTARGFAVLRFDFTGLGASEGEFENTNFSSNVQDLLCAADFLRQEYQAPALLVGHSLGGAAVLAAAGDIAEAQAVVTVGAPAEPAHVQHLFTDKRADIEQHGVAEVLLAGRPFRIKQQFLEDIEKTRLAEKISAMGKALLIFHSVADTTVGIENARKIYEAAKHPKSFISLDRADHLLSDKRDGVYVSDVLAAWAQRYLPAAQAAATDAAGVEQQAVDEDSTVVVESVGSGLAQKITNGKHELVADEPSSLGGSNTGPTPYGYLLSALGACTAITLRMYANLKKLPLTKVTVTLRHEKKHIEDCAECENKANKVDRITRVLKIEGDLSEEQRQRMLVIADKCPIHKTLNTPVIIETELEK
ncbi:MAG: bifunctional alpha/beta hydrolase/OsmC family protein [Proteobacteria bacterium]|nr:bifunctional alpha/beta hydrolase/OsmC family protein [Pseudomonadota bacterium]